MPIKNKISSLEKDLILAHVLKKSREWILTYPKIKLSPDSRRKIDIFIRRRLKGEPLAYILGHKEFYGLDFLVNKNVLIPRPETELMVDEVLNLITHNSQPITGSTRTCVIDIGAGSGCIIIALAKLLNRKSQIANHKFFAADISASALSVAKKNAKIHGLDKQIKFLRGDLLKPVLTAIKSKKLIIDNRGLIIVSNLPYLTPAQIKKSPSIKYEPRTALSAGPDGLKYYRRLFARVKLLSAAPAGRIKARMAISLLCEIDPSQKRSIAALAKKYFPLGKIQIKKDLRGHSRLAVIRLDDFFA